VFVRSEAEKKPARKATAKGRAKKAAPARKGRSVQRRS
jgi:hypothetical protein